MSESNKTAAKSGDLRRALEALRDTLAEQLDMTEAQIHAQLAAQYRATLSDLAALDAAEPKPGVTPLDEITTRRQARSGPAPDHPRAARRRKSGDG